MKGKLIKQEEHYILLIVEQEEFERIFATTSLFLLENKNKLSVKNCEAIVNGYDLDELAESEHPLCRFENQNGELEDLNEENRNAFMEGFKQALEILGDKKFSEEDMISFGLFCINNIDAFNDVEDLFKKWKSLQQTEWQVEVIMDRIPADLAPGGWDVFPKLDKEGCIVLKRVE